MSKTTAAARSVTRFLTSPSGIAHALDWKKVTGSILSLTILQNRIDIAVASHPASHHPLLESLPSIPIRTETVNNVKVLSSGTIEELSKIVEDWNICGFLVSWPMQEEGWCGAPCGRVLHVLDQLSENEHVLNDDRRVCLWDDEHHFSTEDEWGRNAIYSVTSSKSVHVASKEQYQDHETVAADVWNDFCRAHWPEIYQYQRQNPYRFFSGEDFDDYDNDDAYGAAAAF